MARSYLNIHHGMQGPIACTLVSMFGCFIIMLHGVYAWISMSICDFASCIGDKVDARCQHAAHLTVVSLGRIGSALRSNIRIFGYRHTSKDHGCKECLVSMRKEHALYSDTLVSMSIF